MSTRLLSEAHKRIGRLLIALLLEHWKILKTPLLYLSLAFKRYQREYYDRLSAVRTDGDWEGWTEFFLACVHESADDGIDVARKLLGLFNKDRRRLTGHGRATVAAIHLLDMLPEHPMVTVPGASELLMATAPTARKPIDILVELGVLHETTGKQRDRVAYHTDLQILTGDEA